MSTSSKEASTALVPNIFGAPSLLEGEDTAAYQNLRDRISSAVKPADVLDEIWVRDVADLAWEILRLRRLKAQLLVANFADGLWAVLSRLLEDWDSGEVWSLVSKWRECDEAAVKLVQEQLDWANLTLDAAWAETLLLKINEVERIDRLTTNAEIRRNAALRELDRHRATLAEALRRATEEIIDGEFEELELKPRQKLTKKSAA